MLSHGLRRLGAVRTEPVGGPIERAKKCPRRDRGIRGVQHAPPNAVLDKSPDPPFVLVALGDNRGSQPQRQRAHFEVRRGPFNVVDQTEDVGHGERVEPLRQRAARPPRPLKRREESIERTPLTKEEQLLFAFEVVIQIPGRQVCSGRDIAHTGRGEPDGTERPGGGTQDLEAPRVSAQ